MVTLVLYCLQLFGCLASNLDTMNIGADSNVRGVSQTVGSVGNGVIEGLGNNRNSGIAGDGRNNRVGVGNR